MLLLICTPIINQYGQEMTKTSMVSSQSKNHASPTLDDCTLSRSTNSLHDICHTSFLGITQDKLDASTATKGNFKLFLELNA